MSETTGEAMSAETEKEWTKRDLRHTSAVVICPPTSTWEPIQRIRAVNDKSYTRWMPHINLLYPFLLDDGEDEGNFDRAAAKAREALRDIEPFTVSLRTFGHFAHAKSCTVWLHPSGHGEEADDDDDNGSPEASGGFRNSADSLPPVSDSVMATQAALERAFPFANDLSTISAAGFTPHLSVGQYDDKETASEAESAMNATWAPMTFEVDAVYIISRAGPDAPFEFKARVPLGASAGASAAGPNARPPGTPFAPVARIALTCRRVAFFHFASLSTGAAAASPPSAGATSSAGGTSSGGASTGASASASAIEPVAKRGYDSRDSD